MKIKLIVKAQSIESITPKVAITVRMAVIEPNIELVEPLISSISAENRVARAAGDSAKRFAKSILTKELNILYCKFACTRERILFCNNS